MADKSDRELVIDEDEMCESIAKKTRVDADIVQDVLDVEVEYLEQNGTEGESDRMRPITDELVEFIASRADVEKATVTKILQAEITYLKSRGV